MSTAATLKNDSDKLSYAIGVNLGQNFNSQGVAINPSALLQGLEDGLAGKTPALTDAQRQTLLSQYEEKVMNKQADAQKNDAENYLKEGQAFLASNAKEKGVVVLKDGLQYKIMTEGDGALPKASDKVEVNYEGALINGTVFDSSYKRGQSITFGVNQVIKGWTEALQLMPEGSTWMLYIPANLAYGDKGIPGVIPPNSVLVFKVELIKVNP